MKLVLMLGKCDLRGSRVREAHIRERLLVLLEYLMRGDLEVIAAALRGDSVHISLNLFII